MTTTKTMSHFDAAALNDGGRLWDLRFDAGSGSLRLADRVLVEDDAPAIGRPEGATDRAWFEALTPGVRIRKRLRLDDGRARAAWLTWCGCEPEGNEVPLHLSVNGVDLVRPATKFAHPQCRHYYTSDWAPSHFDNWFVVELPAGALRSGDNTIELWVEDGAAAGPAWEVMVAADSERPRGSDPPRPPVGRSARSRDGGTTWHTGGLGRADAIDGEYCIRLSLDRHPGEGAFRSVPLDLAGADRQTLHTGTVTACAATWEVDGDDEGRVEVRVRFGDTPLEDADSWSAWQRLDGLHGKWTAPAGRWLQFEARLTTDDPRRSPGLLGVTLAATLEAAADDGPRVRLQGLRDGRVLRPSAATTWEDPERLADLRRRFDLDAVVAGAATEFEAQLRLLHWAYRIPIGRLDPYAWRYDDLPKLERDADGAIRLLGPYDRPRREGHCLYCNLTLVAALLSFGYPARWVNISTKHTYGHEVTEVWSNDFDKWVFLDATRDYYMVDPDTGLPLSLTEIGARVAEILPEPVTWDRPIPGQLPQGASPENVRVEYRRPDHGGPVFAPGAEHDLLMIGHLQMPLRTDFASRPTPVPWRVSSNWGSSEFYCWWSPMFPPKLEYPRGTDRLQDWEPPLNRVQLALSRTDEQALLRVDADTVTPWFDAFEVEVDDGPAQRRAGAQWSWLLHEGRNRLRVRARNRAGVCGPWSEAVVLLTP